MSSVGVRLVSDGSVREGVRSRGVRLRLAPLGAHAVDGRAVGGHAADERLLRMSAQQVYACALVVE